MRLLAESTRRNAVVVLAVAFLALFPLMVSGCGGGTWTNTGGEIKELAVESLAVDPTHNLLYAGTFGHGVWKYDGTWHEMRGGTAGYIISALAYDTPHNILYAGSWNGGVWKYNGTSWASTRGSIATYKVDSLACDSKRNLLYASCFDDHTAKEKGVWKYDGVSWTDTGAPHSSFEAYNLTCDSMHGLLYAGGYGGGVWKYDGASWVNTGGGVESFEVGPLAYDTKHNVLCAGCFADTDSESGRGMWKYDGVKWTGVGEASFGYAHLACDPKHDLVYGIADQSVTDEELEGGGNVDRDKPLDAVFCVYDGDTWSSKTAPSMGRVTSLVYDQKNDVLFAGSFDNGVWKY